MYESLIILLAALLVIGFVVAFSMLRARSRHRSAALRERFGPEYDNAIERYGNVKSAERELRRREGSVKKLHIRPLSSTEYERFSAGWAATQKQFVDDPIGAIRVADALIKDVMQTRGYPMGDFEQRVAQISVDHAGVVQHYRAARALVTASESGEPSTEDLRQAMIHFRALFQDLLEVEVTPEHGHHGMREVRA